MMEHLFESSPLNELNFFIVLEKNIHIPSAHENDLIFSAVLQKVVLNDIVL